MNTETHFEASFLKALCGARPGVTTNKTRAVTCDGCRDEIVRRVAAGSMVLTPHGGVGVNSATVHADPTK